MWYHEKDYSTLFYDGAIIDDCEYDDTPQFSEIGVHSGSIFINMPNMRNKQLPSQYWIYKLKQGEYKNYLPIDVGK